MDFCDNNIENKSKACIENMELPDTLSSAYRQLTSIHTWHDAHDAFDLAEHYLQRGLEATQQLRSDQYFNALIRSFLALLYSKKGRKVEALIVGEAAFQDALSQGGMITPICELILSAILMENGDHEEAKKRLENSAGLLKKMSLPLPFLKDNGDSALETTKSMKFEKSSLKPKVISPGETGSYLFRIQMFGPLRVFHENREIDATSWRTVKSRDLLAYFAHQDKPVSTDQILEDLWPDLNITKASAVFHTTLYYLRRHLQQFTDKEIIIRGAKRYQLRPGSVLIDRHQFEEVAHLALKKTMTGALANELEAALMLCRGDYLEDLDYQWVIPVQEGLKNIISELKQELAIYYLQNKMYSRAENHLRQLMALKPYSEEVLRLLLTSLARMGDIYAIKEHYAVFAQTILEELGLRPSSHITAFYKEICDINQSLVLETIN